MSSHHIIREHQEPALIVYDFTGFSFEYLQQLLGWSPLVVASERSFSELVELGIKVDVLIINGPNHKFGNLIDEQVPIEVVYARDFLNGAIELLDRKRHYAFSIILNDEHSINQIPINGLPEFSISAYCEKKRWLIINDKTFTKWYPKGCQLEVRNLAGQQLEFQGTLGPVVLENDQRISVTQNPPFAVIEDLTQEG
ncbi:MAG: hypothetical protein JXQ90_12715 [Cyclobacteriaceae bacterium]